MKKIFILLFILCSVYASAQTDSNHFTNFTNLPTLQTYADRWEGITLKANVYSVMHIYKEDLIRPFIGFETGYTILNQTLTINAGVALCPVDGKYLINGGLGIKLFKPQVVDAHFLSR